MALNSGQRRYQREETAPSRLLAVDLRKSIKRQQARGCSASNNELLYRNSDEGGQRPPKIQ